MEHRAFSARLSAFAGSVRGIIDRHHGALVYAAGEDIVALLPLDGCVDCADELRTTFHDSLLDLSADGKPMTLSVGIAIGHFLDALEDIHQAVRDMLDEKAKGFDGKNALAIQYHSRGGAPVECVYSWNQQPDPRPQLRDWETMLRSGDLPQKIAYDVRQLAETYKLWASSSDADKSLCRRAMITDLGRLLSSKKASARDVSEPLVQAVTSPDDVVNVANTIIMASLIAKSRSLSEGTRE